MSVRRVMGIETEYGITVPGQPHANAMVASSQIVNAYAGSVSAGHRLRAKWDFDEEHPLRDARGFDMSRADADPSQLTDEDLGLANVVLTNGARLYVDHAHPEYSSPEVLTPRDALLWDKAGERVMAKAVEVVASMPGLPAINLYKNNTDNKGASYGTHENYLMRRTTPFADIVRHLTPFFVSRQVYSGSGRVGIGQEGGFDGFQLSQRADYFEVEVGLETTLKRPIINTRDEPHADPERHRRLHVIVGDANLAETATLLKMGATSLVLWLIEENLLDRDFRLARPVDEMHAVSHDTGLSHLMRLQDGRTMTAVQMQMEFLEQARKHVDDRYGCDVDGDTAQILQLWEDTMDRLHRDPMELAGVLDWPTKLQILEGYIARDDLSWSDQRLHAIDLQYSDVRPDKGLALRLMKSGRIRTVLTPDEVDTAVIQPPSDTRAWFRGECVRRYPDAVAAASWDSVIFDIEGRSALQRVPTLEPTRGTRSQVGHILDASPTAADLLQALTGMDSAPQS
jgi:Pup amidohydrolase